jgi:hypothetical protein
VPLLELLRSFSARCEAPLRFFTIRREPTLGLAL